MSRGWRGRGWARLAGVILASTACTSSVSPPASEPPESEIPSASASARSWGAFVTAAIALDHEAGALAVSNGSVWVAPHLSPVILRIDPTTNAVAETLELPGGGPPAELDADEQSVWASVSTPSYSFDHLVGIDAASAEIVVTAEVAAAFPKIGGAYVWATGDDGLFKIDRETGTLLSTIDLQGCWTVATPSWAWCSTEGTAHLVDSATDAVTDVDIDHPLGPAVEVIGSVVWGISADGASVWLFDVEAGSLVADLPAPEGVAEFLPDAAILGGSVWIVGRDGASWYVVPVEVASLTVGQPLAIADPEFGIAAGLGALWIPVIRTPVVLRIEPPD